jgi:hypothetical protein
VSWLALIGLAVLLLGSGHDLLALGVGTVGIAWTIQLLRAS